MEARNKFSILCKLLGAIGPSLEAVDDIIDRIIDFLSDKGEQKGASAYPYVLSGNFLSPAKHKFFSVLRTTVSNHALISVKDRNPVADSRRTEAGSASLSKVWE